MVVNTPAAKHEIPLVELTEATVALAARGHAPGVEKVNWRLRPGDFWVIGGTSGAGKSDFLATAAGLQRPLSGIVQWRGRDIATLGEQELVTARMKIGLVFENQGRMFRHLSVAENIVLPLRYHHDLGEAEARQTLEEILALTGLTERAAALSGNLSPGWQQRVGLARALVLRPAVLLVDKPAAGGGHGRWWLDFLGKLAAGIPFTSGQAVALAVTTDDLKPWLQVGRQFAVLQHHRWHGLGDRSEWAGQAEPLWPELLSSDTP